MEKTIRLLRISFWCGILIDGAVAYLMIKSAIFGATSSLTNYTPDLAYRFAMGVAGSLMLGWTALLFWGDKKPVERAGILALTVFPVLTGLFISTLFGYTAGFMPHKGTLLICSFLGALIILMSYSYFRAMPKK